MAASQVRILSAKPRYSRFFNDVAGRPLDAGPLGATCDQPDPLDENMTNDDLVQWWLKRGGYSSCNQVDENGWTPLHHCIEAMVHWDQAWKIGVALIETMAASQEGQQWLRAKTEAGQPSHRTALHMLSNNSDRALKKAEMVTLLAGIVQDVDPEDDQGRTPLMHAVGTGVLDIAKALVEAGADPHKVSHDGRNIANRCGCSGMVRNWVLRDLGVKPANVSPETRYRKPGEISLSRLARYAAKAEMDRAEAVSQGKEPAPAASSSRAPSLVAKATPLAPSSNHRRADNWTWFWDDAAHKWSWYWLE